MVFADQDLQKIQVVCLQSNLVIDEIIEAPVLQKVDYINPKLCW